MGGGGGGGDRPVVHIVANPVVRVIRLVAHINKINCAKSYGMLMIIMTKRLHTWPLVMNRDAIIGFSGAWFLCGLCKRFMNSCTALLTWCYSAYLASQIGTYHRAWSPTIAELHALVLSHLQVVSFPDPAFTKDKGLAHFA